MFGRKGVILFLFICMNTSYAQMSEKDSLILNRNIEQLSDSLYVNLDFSKEIASKLLNESIYYKSKYFQIKCWNLIGEVNMLKAEYPLAQNCFEKSLELAIAGKYQNLEGSAYEYLSMVLIEFGKNEDALEFLYKSLAIKEKTGKKKYLGTLYNTIGNVHYFLDNIDSSNFFYKKALAIGVELNDTELKIACYSSLADVFYYQDYFSKAITYYKISLELHKDISIMGTPITPLYNIASVYSWIGEKDSALFYYTLALENAKERENYENYDEIYLALAETYTELGQSDSAITMFQYYNAYRDTIFSQERTNAVFDATEKYKSKEKDQQIVLEQEKSAKIQLEDQNKRKTIYILIALLLLISGVILYLIRNARQKTKLNQLKVNLKNQEIDQLLKEQEAKSYAAVLEGQSTERKRIAQDLHDRLGGTLAAVKLHFNVINEKIDTIKSENTDLFETVNNMLSEAVQDVRRISHDLASDKIAKLGLRGALTDLVFVLQSAKKIEVDFFMDESELTFDKKKEQAIYAIIQEIISNALKHSSATAITIQLNQRVEVYSILIEDNGIGFNIAEVKKGLGIVGLKKRVKHLNGTIEFDSIIGRGTIVDITLPL